MKEKKSAISRRQFVTSAATSIIAGPLAFEKITGVNSQKDVLNHACIGVGGMGGHDLRQFK
ncbi:MAG: gfo/Idh/MocA family oxidoreductase, partial [Chitinophagaceae bacterium]|nr:gfo/Idh/MocA family oxidoreductase [Chitinophagaceae bacterium]